MRGKLGDLKAVGLDLPFELIAIVLAFCCFVQVDEEAFPGWDLDPFISQVCCPFAHPIQGIEWGFVVYKLRQEYGRPFNRFHSHWFWFGRIRLSAFPGHLSARTPDWALFYRISYI